MSRRFHLWISKRLRERIKKTVWGVVMRLVLKEAELGFVVANFTNNAVYWYHKERGCPSVIGINVLKCIWIYTSLKLRAFMIFKSVSKGLFQWKTVQYAYQTGPVLDVQRFREYRIQWRMPDQNSLVDTREKHDIVADLKEDEEQWKELQGNGSISDVRDGFVNFSMLKGIWRKIKTRRTEMILSWECSLNYRPVLASK